MRPSRYGSTCFARETDSDNNVLEFVQEWEILQSPDEKKRESGFDKIPMSRQRKLVCMIAAKATGRSFTDCYERMAYGAVLEELGLALAAGYVPDEKE